MKFNLVYVIILSAIEQRRITSRFERLVNETDITVFSEAGCCYYYYYYHYHYYYYYYEKRQD